MFSNATFTNDDRFEEEHCEIAKTLVLRWLNFRARVGPAELDSVSYNNMDIADILKFVEFARDHDGGPSSLRYGGEIHLQHMGTSLGRANVQKTLSAAGDSLMTIQTQVFGYGPFQSINMATTMLVTSRRYTVPPGLETFGCDMAGEIIHFERHLIPLPRLMKS